MTGNPLPGAAPRLLIALLPPLDGEQWPREEIAAAMTAAELTVEVVPELSPGSFGAGLDAADAWVSHCALNLSRVEPELPRLLVAYGQSAGAIAAVGFSQRAAQRAVVGYVLVDGDMPRPGLRDWPDAPVTYIGGREASLARLRGWELLPGEDVAADLRQVARDSV